MASLKQRDDAGQRDHEDADAIVCRLKPALLGLIPDILDAALGQENGDDADQDEEDDRGAPVNQRGAVAGVARRGDGATR